VAEATTSKRTTRAAGSATRKAARPRAKQRPPDTATAARTTVAEVTAGSRYLTAVIEHAAEQAQAWEAANRALVEEVGALQRTTADRLSQQGTSQLGADAPADLAGVLEAQQAYVDELNAAAETYRSAYEHAILGYTERAESLLAESRRQAAADFGAYVDELRSELAGSATEADPQALAQLGLALLAMSQLSAATSPG
jgi:hypothetical protein